MQGDVIILAAGPSVKEYNLRGLEERGHLIAVNGASIYSKCHMALTMDRLIFEHCLSLWRVQGVPEIWIRKGINKKGPLDNNVTEFVHDGDREGTDMSMQFGHLNGSNSGTCAFNLALQHAIRGTSKRIFMLGYDMIRFDKECNPYWYPAFEWNKAGGTKDGNLKAWAEEYFRIVPQVQKLGVQVYNVNHTTRLNMFPVISYDKFRSMT